MDDTRLVNKTQIVVLGAGIGGCIAALALAPFYSVVLVDLHSVPKERVGECLAPAAGRILHKLRLSELLNDGHLTSHGLLSYWGTETPTLVDHLANPDGHGWHLDRQLFEQQLRDVVQMRGVSCLWPARFVKSEQTPDGWCVELQHNSQQTEVHCQLVIDATGRHSSFARALGQSRQNFDQQLSVWLTAAVKVRKHISVLSSVSEGWWYSAPLPKLPFEPALQAQADFTGTAIQARLFALQIQASQLDKNLSQCSRTFLKAAAEAPGLGTLVQQIIPGTEQLHAVVAANSSKLSQGCGEGWFAIGDAALSFDPLSSQGIFNAMATAMQLAELLIEHGLHYHKTSALYQAQLDSIWQHYLDHKKRFYEVVE
ncbi:MAG: tryptophan 7-halogenase [Gammaproteobacteria bacterium]|nr:tryptophan 7-halogenase [Gammaproteobacteria bacterium]MBU2057204.1 tryptophan 7-halogenase [Gammaproteobacteria bacterium]MBU2174945.1 tryptophan 7-halogenase [Gammaproteobacteria bacterium]MBU2246292.1 tryptophan 7-halogenase [Gammaproteobacteria bacterium]MBU2344422.1 tryptophan 7-halogenase [Gammaproteobacteria bacterium]